MKLIIEELHGAACYLRKHPEATAAEVGEFVGKSKRTIERWSTTAEWHTALDNLGFVGDRSWRRELNRDIKRDSGERVDLGKQTYLRYRSEGLTKGKATRATAREINCGEKTIYNWRKRFGWDNEVSH